MKINRDTLHVKLEHLKDEEILGLIEKYYNGVKIQTILDEYKIALRPSELYKSFPLFDAELSCEYCNTSMLAKALSKSDYDFKKSGKQFNIYCPNCSHTITSNCHCDGCKNKIELENYRRYKHIIDNALYPYSKFKDTKVQENDLLLWQRFYLTILLRTQYDVRRNVFMSFKDSNIKLFTIPYVENILLRELLETGIIYPSDVKLTHISKNGDLLLRSLEFRLNIEPFDNDESNLYNRLRYVEKQLFLNDKEFCLKWWNLIFRFETLEYIKYYSNLNNLSLTISPVSYQRLDEYAIRFSIGQMYNLVWKSIRDMAILNQQNSLNHSRIEETFFSFLNKKSEANEIFNFKRVYQIPESIITGAFFIDVLGLKKDGFLLNIYEHIQNIDINNEFSAEITNEQMEAL